MTKLLSLLKGQKTSRGSNVPGWALPHNKSSWPVCGGSAGGSSGPVCQISTTSATSVLRDCWILAWLDGCFTLVFLPLYQTVCLWCYLGLGLHSSSYWFTYCYCSSSQSAQSCSSQLVLHSGFRPASGCHSYQLKAPLYHCGELVMSFLPSGRLVWSCI